jgi:hypothetical protein
VALQRRQRVLAHRPRRQAGGVGDAAQQVVASSGMSSRRSLSGGTRSATTFSRWKSSSRKRRRDLVLQGARVEASTRTSTSTWSCRRRAVGLLLQHARQPALQRHRQVGDLLQQQRAAMRHLEGAGDAQRSPSAAVGAEQLDLEPLRRQGRAVDDDERPSARLEPWWISRATVSLPAPEGR